MAQAATFRLNNPPQQEERELAFRMDRGSTPWHADPELVRNGFQGPGE